jgi:hypothetical protein
MKRCLEDDFPDRPAKQHCASKACQETHLPESISTKSDPLPSTMGSNASKIHHEPELRPDVKAVIPKTPTILGRFPESSEASFAPLPAPMLPIGRIAPCPCGCGRDPLAPLPSEASDLEPLAMLFFTNEQFRDTIVTNEEYCYAFLVQFPYMEEMVEEEVMWRTLPGSPDDLIELFYTESDFRSLVARDADVRKRFLRLCPDMGEEVEYEVDLRERSVA